MAITKEVLTMVEKYEAITQMTADERAANGARWLDESFPGWESRININTLQLDDSSSCICGQVFAMDSTEDDGYGYASGTLFSEANHWITALVGIKVVRNDAPDKAVTHELRDKLYHKRSNRRIMVAAALGFDCLSAPDIATRVYRSLTEDEAVQMCQRVNNATPAADLVGFSDLQEAWERLLIARANATV